jgi:hypothetical protein
MFHITFDLDNTIFHNAIPICKAAFFEAGLKFHTTKFYDYSDYPEKVREIIWRLYGELKHLDLPPFNKKLPGLINALTLSEEYRVSFVTTRDDRYGGPETPRQFQRYGIILGPGQLFHSIHSKDKGGVLKEIGSDLHYDDEPKAIESCITNGVDSIMISNRGTLYNHHLRGKAKWTTSLAKSLAERLR